MVWRVPAAVSLLLVAGGCADQIVVRHTIGVARTNGAGLGALSVSVQRKDGGPTGATGWRIVLDGKPAVYAGDGTAYPEIVGQGNTVVYAPPGRYALTLEDGGGEEVATAGVVEVFDQDETNVLFYGDAGALRSFVVDPSMPRHDAEGRYLLRMLDVMAGGEPLDVVKDCDTTAEPPVCATVRTLSYGELFELAVPPASATSYAVRYTTCGAQELCVVFYRKALLQTPDGELPFANAYPARAAIDVYPLSF